MVSVYYGRETSSLELCTQFTAIEKLKISVMYNQEKEYCEK